MTVRDRVRAVIGRGPATPLTGWSADMPAPQPLPDIDAAVAQVIGWIDAHVAAGSIDEAHAAVLDRMLDAITDQWRENAKRHYLNQERQLAATRREGVEHLTKVGRELELVVLDCARHRAFFDARWSKLTAAEREHLKVAPDASVPPASDLPALAPHHLLALAVGRTYPPFKNDLPPASQLTLDFPDPAAVPRPPISATRVNNHHPVGHNQ
jgi:hypothetical protein